MQKNNVIEQRSADAVMDADQREITAEEDVGNATVAETAEEQASEKKQKAKKIAKKSVSYLAKVSILSAMAVILLYIEFPLLPAVPHLKLNVSDVPALLASFMFGPITGTIVNAVKVGMCLLLRGTSTGFVGDLSNLVSGTLYVVVAGVVYLIKKNKLGAILALISSSIVFCVAMWFCNQWFLLPMFGIKDQATMMPMLWWTLLFNFIKTTLTCVITMFIYKGTHRLFNRF